MPKEIRKALGSGNEPMNTLPPGQVPLMNVIKVTPAYVITHGEADGSGMLCIPAEKNGNLCEDSYTYPPGHITGR